MWLTPERLRRLKQYAAQNTGRWERVKAYADRGVDQPLPPHHYIPALAMAYQITGEPKYAQAAIRVMVDFCVPKNTLREDANFWYRTVLPDTAAAYDWCYDQMTSDQRRQIASWLMDRADAVWPETNGGQKVWAWDTPANNYFWGLMMTWPAALAVYGDDDRAARHIQLARDRWSSMARPFLDGWGRGGVFAESMNYDSTWRIAHILSANLSATGEDLANEPGFDFLRQSVLWRLHATTPDLAAKYPLGDYPGTPLDDIDRFRVFGPLHLTQDNLLRSFGNYWLKTIAKRETTLDSTVAWEFFYCDEDVPTRDYTESLNTSYFAEGPGIFLKRSGWGPQATYWGVWAGKLQQGHQARDVNGFHLYKGGWLVGNASIWSHAQDATDTEFWNNLTFGSHQQYWLQENDTNRTLAHELGSDYTYFCGDGAAAYNGRGAVLRTYTRQLVSLQDETFLVYDHVVLVDPDTPRTWHLHTKGPIEVQGRRYTLDNGSYRLHGTLLLPAEAAELEVQPMKLAADGSTSSYRLRETVNPHRAESALLNVLSITPVQGTAPDAPTQLSATTGDMEGARIGAWAVLFGKTGTVSGSISYPVDSGTRKHLLLNLKPATEYQVSRTGTDGKANPALRFKSTADGTGRFDLEPGEARSLSVAPL